MSMKRSSILCRFLVQSIPSERKNCVDWEHAGESRPCAADTFTNNSGESSKVSSLDPNNSGESWTIPASSLYNDLLQ